MGLPEKGEDNMTDKSLQIIEGGIPWRPWRLRRIVLVRALPGSMRPGGANR